MLLPGGTGLSPGPGRPTSSAFGAPEINTCWLVVTESERESFVSVEVVLVSFVFHFWPYLTSMLKMSGIPALAPISRALDDSTACDASFCVPIDTVTSVEFVAVVWNELASHPLGGW